MRDERGSIAVEWVLAMVGVLLGLALAVQVIVWHNAQQTVTDAAQSALVEARLAGGSDAAAREKADQILSQLGGNITNAKVTIQRTGQEVTVEVTGLAAPPKPLPAFRLRATATGPIERFVPAGR